MFSRKTTSKYRNKKVSFNGIIFDSKREKDRYLELIMLEKANIVKDLKLQVPFILVDKSKWGRAIKYIADFTYISNDQLIVEDCKGFHTPVYKLKKRLFSERYGVEIKET